MKSVLEEKITVRKCRLFGDRNLETRGLSNLAIDLTASPDNTVRIDLSNTNARDHL